MTDADYGEDQYLTADASEADRAGQLLVRHCTHYAGDMVNDDESEQRDEQSVTASRKVSKPAAHGSSYDFDNVPEFYHNKFFLFDIRVIESGRLRLRDDRFSIELWCQVQKPKMDLFHERRKGGKRFMEMAET